MRILNRPMFRYGGPIKEGVMHGMRDGGRAALVGNPVYPQTGGREHHKINIQDIKDPRKAAVKKGGIWLASKVPGFTKGWAKRMWDKYKFPSAYSPTRTSYHQTRPMMERLGKYVRQHPVLTGGGAFLGAQSEPVKGIAKGAWNLIPEVAQFGAEAIMPKEGFGPFKEKYLPPDEWWKWKSDVKWKPGDVRGEEGGGDGTETETGTSSRWKDIGTAPELTASQREKIRKDEQNKRLKNYLDMMGYDSSKRRALDDALIDASALVQDASTEAGSLKKADWGNLINRMIQTTSKRLDKPAQIREAVGLMSVKAAIQKDLEDPQVKELRALQIKEKEKLLNAGPSALITAHMASRKGSLDAKDLAILMRDYGIQNDIPVGVITKTQVTEEYGKDGKPAMDIIKDKKITEDGIYVIGKEVIQIIDGKSIQLA
mgnify:CR=1 FL=1